MNGKVNALTGGHEHPPRPAEAPLDENALSETLDLLKALAVETRLRIVLRLLEGERCVCEIWPGLGEQSNISRHLKKLNELGVISRRDEGNRHYYAIADQRVRDFVLSRGIKKL